MAKKKDEQLTYGQMPLPQGQNAHTRLKVEWSGLNRRQTVDTGVLSMESNISTAEAPYLTPSQKPYDMSDRGAPQYDNPISMFGFDGFAVVVYRDGKELKIDYIELSDNGKRIERIHTGYVTLRDDKGNITKRTVDKSTDSIQRSMVQFNVYENAADVLDGVYVKKLLLFPDKVSMYMKIVSLPTNIYKENGDVVSLPIKSDNDGNKVIDFSDLYNSSNNTANKVYNSANEDTRKKVEVTNPDVLYCYKERYFAWNGKGYTQSGTEKGYFMTDALDVVVKEYYNDGFEAATGTYDDGYRLSSHRWFNYDGYKPMDGLCFHDGFAPASGTYSENGTTKYYERSGISPYTYTEAVLNDGDSLAGLFKAVNVSANATIGTIWRRSSGDNYPFEYTVVADSFTNGDSLDGYYMYVGLKYYPFTQETLYTRNVTDDKDNTVNISKGTVYKSLNKTQTFTKRSVEYADAKFKAADENGKSHLLKYRDDISDLYEKTGNMEIKSYYKRGGMNSKTGMYDYTPVDESKLAYGKDVSKYYTYTGNYAPPEGSSHNCYWRNTATQMCYCYDNEKKEWAVAYPPAFPNLKYAAVHLSRLFGVDEDRVHVSGFNDYANWNLDTVTETNESNAWSSAAQANTKANGEFTGITVYDNHVVCFKRDFMHEIYNNKNPFRLVDVYAEGSIDNRSIQEVDGRLIFVSDDEVKVYTGGNPRIIGYYLGIDKFTAAVSGTDGRNYYLYCEDEKFNKYLFVYDTFVEQWSQRAIDSEVKNFAHNKNGMYMLTDEGIIYKLDTGKYNHKWSFETDMSTSLTASSSSSYPTVSIKHISKFQMLAHIQKGAHMEIYALYDGEEYSSEWKDNNKSHLLWESGTDTKNDRMIPIRLKPRVTANYGFKLHFEGEGYVRLYEMELRTTAGGELYR